MKTLLSTICFASITLLACQSKNEFKSISVDEFETLIAQPNVQRLDVRTLEEYTNGHIPGSLNLDVKEEEHFTLTADSILNKEHPVAVYCRSGNRSKKAAKILCEKGYEVYELSTGITGWKAAGKAIE